MRLFSSYVTGCAAELAKNAYSEGDLGILFMQAGLDEFQPQNWHGKAQLVATTLLSAKREAAEGNMAAREGLSNFVQLVAERTAPLNPTEDIRPGSPFEKFREAVRSDGFDLHVEYESVAEGWSSETARSVRLLPLDEPRAPLSEEITALENNLTQLSLNVSLNCYRQAVDSLVDQRFESANGQMRAVLEAVIIHFAVARGFSSTKQGAGGTALAYLIDEGHLPERHGGNFIRGLWQIIQTNGPHPGTSNAGEAYFRLQSITSAVHYLIDRFTSLAEPQG